MKDLMKQNLKEKINLIRLSFFTIVLILKEISYMTAAKESDITLKCTTVA